MNPLRETDVVTWSIMSGNWVTTGHPPAARKMTTLVPFISVFKASFLKDWVAAATDSPSDL